MSNAFSFDVFLSHNANDKPRVRRLAERLQAAGLRIWFDDWIIQPGDDIYFAVEQGLQAARALVLCMSPDALGSGWVGLERSTVLFRDPGNAGRRFVPLLVADCELPDTLRRYKYVDYREEFGAAFEELLIACRDTDQQGPPREEAINTRPGLSKEPRSTRREGEPPATPPRPEENRKPGKEPALATGWHVVNIETLAELTADRPDVGTMAGYFDGTLPDWQVVLAEGVRPRRIVETTAARFRQRHHGAPRPLATLLTGAGGEGKSTALLQVAAALVRDATQSWTCLHREAAAAEVPESLLEGLEFRAGHAWIVALDDAENAGKGLVVALRRIAPRTDVHLLLAAREADWTIRGLTRDLWRDVAEFRPEPMPGLDEEDARRIVAGWQAYGDDAMGRLRRASAEEAAKALLGHANEHAARPGAGALLGALLITRQGKELKDRVRAFVSPLAGRGGVKGFDLRDIYAMIAAMHAENQLYLSRSVLAFALGCDEDELERVLWVLRREAMLDSGETYILSRHRRIAEAACEVLEDEEYNLKRWFPHLAQSALREFKIKYSRNPDIATWLFAFAEHFVGKGEKGWTVARNIAKALYEADENDPMRLTAYSKVLRQTKVPGDAMALLKAKGEQFRSRRDVLYEWSVVAGAIGDHGLNAWLAGRSLADGGTPPDATRCKLSLRGLGRSFEVLHEATGLSVFANARAACGRLGLSLPDLDATTKGYFEKDRRAEAEGAGPCRSHKEDEQTLQRAVAAAADEMEPDNDPLFFENLLGEPNGYHYAGLLRVIGADVPVKRTKPR